MLPKITSLLFLFTIVLSIFLCSNCTSPTSSVDTLYISNKDTLYLYGIDTLYIGNRKMFIRSGILYDTEKEEENYWDIKYIDTTDITIILGDTLILNCWVRKGSGYMWTQPTWYYTNWYVRIFDDENTDPADEYIITVLKP